MVLAFPVHEPKMWDDLEGQFTGHLLDEVNADLKAAGRPLGSELKQQ